MKHRKKFPAKHIEEQLIEILFLKLINFLMGFNGWKTVDGCLLTALCIMSVAAASSSDKKYPEVSGKLTKFYFSGKVTTLGLMNSLLHAGLMREMV